MSGKSIPTELSPVPSLAARLLFFLNFKRLKVWLWWLAVILIVVAAIFLEIQTSLLQSWFFTSTNERLFYTLKNGPSREIIFPRAAPFDERRGYSKLPAFQNRLESQGYRVTKQMRQSETMLTLLDRGISPPYLERPDAGLEISGADGVQLFRYAQGEFLFGRIDDIPPLLVKTLLFLENRDLDRPVTSWQNPVIEWDRTLKAGLYYLGSKFQLPVPVQGGSTLAVQLEKFRHSPHGRTGDPLEKLRQIVGASLKAYQAGPNTRAWRERIVVDYLNTVPLAAAPVLWRDSRPGRRPLRLVWHSLERCGQGFAVRQSDTCQGARLQTCPRPIDFSPRAVGVSGRRAVIAGRKGQPVYPPDGPRRGDRLGVRRPSARNADQVSAHCAAAAAAVVKQEQSRQRHPRQHDGGAWREQSLRPQSFASASRQHHRCAAAKAGDRISSIAWLSATSSKPMASTASVCSRPTTHRR